MQQLNISKLKYVLFDWDNTLAESRTSLVYAVDKVLANYGLPCWEVSKEKRNRNLSFKDNFPLIFGDKAKEAYEEYREIYKQIVVNKITTFDKVPEVIKFFLEHKVRLIIMTNKERCLLEYELPLLFEKNNFYKIVCGHEAPADKPDGQHALYALKGLLKPEEINRDNVWIIGDSPQDSSVALSIGALPIRINKSIWGDGIQEKDSRIIWVENFSKLLKLLKLAKN